MCLRLYLVYSTSHISCMYNYNNNLVQSQTQIIDDLVMENAELQQQLQSSKREKQILRQQLSMYETELTRAKETIRRDKKQIQEVREQVYKSVYIHRSVYIVYIHVCVCMCV